MVVALLALVTLAYTVSYFTFNDEKLGAFISDRVNRVERGTFTLRKVHYPYWGGLMSLLVNAPVRVYGADYELRDPDGNLVIKTDYAETDAYLQELIASLGRYAVTRRFHLTLHFARARIPTAIAVIAPTHSSRHAAKPEVNIVAAMSPKKPTPPSGGELRITVDDAVLERAHFGIGYPSWHARFVDGRARAALVYSSKKELESDKGPYFFFKIAPLDAPEGELRMGDRLIPLEGIQAFEFGPDGGRREDIVFRAAARAIGTAVTVEGALTDSYSPKPGVRATLTVPHGGSLLALLPAPLGTWLRGDPRLQVTLDGPFDRVAIAGEASGLAADVDGLKIDGVAGRFKVGDGQLKLDPVEAGAAGGRLKASVDVALASPGWWRVQGSVRGVDPGQVPLLPKELRDTLKGRLDATVRAGGNLGAREPAIYAQVIKAELERARPGKLPARIAVSGGFDWTPAKLEFKELTAAGEGLRLQAAGTIDPRGGSVRSTVEVHADHAGFLERLGARGLRLGSGFLRGRVTGTLKRPVLDAQLAVGRLGFAERRVDEIEARVRLEGGTLRVEDLSGHAFGAVFLGEAALELFDETIDRPRADPEVRARFSAKRVSVGALSGRKELSGEADVHLSVEGPLRDPRGQAQLLLPRLVVAGDLYQSGRLKVDLGGGGATIRELHLARAGGGHLEGRGRVGWDGSLALALKPKDFPIGAIPGVSSLPVALSGSISGDVALGGDTQRPTVGGTIALFAAKVRDTLLGDGSLTLVPGADAIAIKGSLFGNVSVDGYLTLFPKFTVAGTVKFRDLELERLIPEMRKLAEVSGRASGEARITFDSESGLTYAGLRLNQVNLTLQSRDDDGSSHKMTVYNREDVLITTDGEVLRIERARLASALGEFSIQGQVSQRASDVRLYGQIGLELLEYFFRSAFEHTHGNGRLDLTIQGDLERPRLTGWLDLSDARLTPKGLEQQRIHVRQGRLDFTEQRVRLQNLAVEMDGALAQASGQIALDRWVPGEISGHVRGELSGRLLQLWLFQEYVQEASGRVAIDVQVGGTLKQPRWSGRAEVKSLKAVVRNWEHDLSLSGGTLAFDNDAIHLGCAPGAARPGCRSLTGAIDDHRVRLDGVVGIAAGPSLGRMRVLLDASEVQLQGQDFVVWVSPKVELSSADGQRLKLSGEVFVNDGRYRQDFDLISDVLLQPRTSEHQRPFWQGMAKLETMQLELRARSTGPLYIKSNVANLSVGADLEISGTLSDPRFDGNINIDEGGTINIPGFRVAFTSNAGRVHFDRSRPIPNETPTLDVAATGYFTDRNDNTITINMRLEGTIPRPKLTMTSSNGLDQSSIFALLLTGATTEDIRRLGNPGAAPTGARGPSVSATEGVMKSVTGLGVGNVLIDPIRKTLGLDVGTVEFGTGSMNVRLCKRFGRYFQTCGLGEVGFATASRVESRLELRISDYWSMLGRVEYVSRGIDTSQDSLTRGKLELRLQVPLGY